MLIYSVNHRPPTKTQNGDTQHRPNAAIFSRQTLRVRNVCTRSYGLRMEHLSTLQRIRWDYPYRFVGSLLGMAWMFAYRPGGNPVFAVLESWAASLDMPWLPDWFAGAHLWSLAHLSGWELVFPLLLAVGVCTLLAYNGSEAVAASRSTSTIWIAAGFSSYSAEPWLVWVVVLGVYGLLSARATFKRSEKLIAYIGYAPVNIISGLFWAIAAPAIWAVSATGVMHARKSSSDEWHALEAHLSNPERSVPESKTCVDVTSTL